MNPAVPSRFSLSGLRNMFTPHSRLNDALGTILPAVDTKTLRRRFRPRTIAILLMAALSPLAARATALPQTVFTFSLPQGTTKSTQSVPIAIPTSGTLSSVSVVTQGTTGLDFTDTQLGDGCVSGSSSNTTCSVNVQFQPKAPGGRYGAVILTFTDINIPPVVQYLYGTSMGPVGVIIPGEINTVAGTGLPTFVADGTPLNHIAATQAPIGLPQGEVVDAAGNFYIADSFNNRIRKVDPTGNITTYVGTGEPGSSGDNGPATSASITKPSGLVMDGAGNLYFADNGSNVIRMVDPTPNHIITTIAGVAGTPGYNGPVFGNPEFNQPQPIAGALLNQPNGLALDTNQNLYLADSGNNLIRVIDLKANPMTITTIAGSLTAGFGGEGQVVSTAVFSEPLGIAFNTSVTNSSYLYVADVNNNIIRRLDLTTTSGLAITVAGTRSNTGSFNGDAPAPATSAQLNNPEGVAVDLAGNILIADTENHRIRKVDIQGNISTLAGSSQGFFGDAMNAGDGLNNTSNTLFDFPSSLFIDASGNLYIGDEFNNRVRLISSGIAILPTVGQIKNFQISSPPQLENFENDGNSTLTFQSFTPVNAALDTTTTSTCSSAPTLPSGQSCTLLLDFAPQVQNLPAGGAITPGTFTIASDAANSTGVINLSGDVLTVNPTTTTLSPNNSTSPSALNAPVTFTATVTNDGNGPLTGAVTFMDAGAPIGTSTTIPAGTVNSGTVTFTFNTSSLTLGSHSITAIYGGDLNNAPSPVSRPITQVIKSGAVLTLKSNLSTVDPSQNFPADITFTAALTNSVTPGAAVITFMDGQSTLGSSTLNNLGFATLSTSTLAPGTHSIVATYPGDTNNLAATSNTLSFTINPTPTTTTLTPNSAANPTATFGTAFTFQATVSVSNGSGAIPTGTVTFTDTNGLPIQTTPLVNGVATLTASLSTGTHTIIATYSDDANNAKSSSPPTTFIVTPILTTTTVTGTSPANAGASITLTASVSGATNVGGPLTGSVSFFDNGVPIGTPRPVSAAGSAVLTISTLLPGTPSATHPITASYTPTANSGNANSNYASSSTSVAFLQVVTQNTPTVAVSSSSTANTSTAGISITLTAAVSETDGAPTPTSGSVTFSSGDTPLGTPVALKSSGLAMLMLSNLPAGSDSIIATYSGDTNDVGAVSPIFVQTVNKATTSLNISASPASSVFGAPVSLTANLTGTGGTLTGTITFLDGGTSIGTVTVDGSSPLAPTFTPPSLSVGSHTITAMYAGDANNNPSSTLSPPTTVVVQQITTGTTLISSANPGVFNQPITLTANVSNTSGSAAPGGSVSFQDSGAVIGTAPLNANGAASLPISTLALGNHSIVAIYSGDTDHSGSQSTALKQQILQAASVVVTSSNPSSVAETNIVFTANVIGVQTLLPTGSVTFKDGASVLAITPVSPTAGTASATGVAVFNTSSLSPGTHTIVASYSGDTNYQPGNSPALTQTIIVANTSVSLASSGNPATFGTALTFTSTVTGTGGSVTGSVTFMDGTSILGKAGVNNSGTATLTTTTLAPGQHTITAVYSGDANNQPNTSFALQQQVQQTTISTIVSSANPTQTLTSIVLSCTVSNGGAQRATGSVTFTDGSTLLGTAALDVNGVATISLPSLAAGQHNVVASYSGDVADFPSNSAPFTQVVQLRPTTDVLTATTTSLTDGKQLTLISVVRWSGPVTPTGTVNFTVGNTIIGTAPVDNIGVATLTIVLDPSAATAVSNYSGDSVYAPSSSPATAITDGPPTSFTLQLSNATPTVQSKQNITVSLAIASLNGFTDNLTLGCLGLPFAATCTFSANQPALLPNTTQTIQVVIDTSAPLLAGTQPQASGLTGGGRSTTAFALFCSALLGLLLMKSRRRHPLSRILVLLCSIALVVGISGCGTLNVNGTPAGTYTFKVTAVGLKTGISQSTNVTLTVQK
ncbi:Ig-like domain repeat protein [Granulicella sp. L60]|uniref:Ig-like domain repeat protein n=1 Tax=Granulicella sp. L60 TaxID=1641866 RepID=UPI00131CDEE5|nr:Ig-like domain repeat protein [Granulicella sp. L60]